MEAENLQKKYNSIKKSYDKVCKKINRGANLTFTALKANILKRRCNHFIKTYSFYTSYCALIKNMQEYCVLVNDYKLSKRCERQMKVCNKYLNGYKAFKNSSVREYKLAYNHLKRARKIDAEIYYSNYSKQNELANLTTRVGEDIYDFAQRYKGSMTNLLKDVFKLKKCIKLAKLSKKLNCATDKNIQDLKNNLKSLRKLSVLIFFAPEYKWPSYYPKQEPKKSSLIDRFASSFAKLKNNFFSSDNHRSNSNYSSNNYSANTYANNAPINNNAYRTNNNNNQNSNLNNIRFADFIDRDDEEAEVREQQQPVQQRQIVRQPVDPKIEKLDMKSAKLYIKCGESYIKISKFEDAKKYLLEAKTICQKYDSYLELECDKLLNNIEGFYKTLPVYESALEKERNCQYEQAYNEFSQAKKDFDKYEIKQYAKECTKTMEKCEQYFPTNDDDYESNSNDDEEDQAYLDAWYCYSTASQWSARQRIEDYEKALEYLAESNCSKASDLASDIADEIERLSRQAAEEAIREAEEANHDYQKQDLYNEAADHYHDAGDTDEEREARELADEYKY